MSTPSDAAASIAARSRLFERCYAARDAAGLVAGYFAADADAPLASPPGSRPPVRGRAALTAMFAAMFADAPAIRLETIDLACSGDLVCELGRAHLTLAGGERVTGRYAVAWIRRDGEWRARMDVFAQDGWTD